MHKTKNFLKSSVRPDWGKTYFSLASCEAGIFLVKKGISILSGNCLPSPKCKVLRWPSRQLRITLISPTLSPGISEQTTKKGYCWSLAVLVSKAQLWLYEVRKIFIKLEKSNHFTARRLLSQGFGIFFEVLLTICVTPSVKCQWLQYQDKSHSQNRCNQS